MLKVVSGPVMGLAGTLRAIEAAERRRQRLEQKRLRELDRQAKNQAKLSTMEQARLEVETYERRVDTLRSVYKEQGDAWDWHGVAASLPPPPPQKSSYHEQRAKQRCAVLKFNKTTNVPATLEQARLQDEQEFTAPGKSSAG